MIEKTVSKGERFHSSGKFTIDETPGCFVCGGDKGMHNAITAFVDSDESAGRIASMFGRGAMPSKLFFNGYLGGSALIRVGACDKHVGNLQYLLALAHRAGNSITQEIVDEAMKHGRPAVLAHR
ncbi:MAG: hypothetical protein M1158_01755 [Candidatus Marsarchaeota archaeon]|nr:hypothetical protein [Candidatus Marsarchaeota archaeon]